LVSFASFTTTAAKRTWSFPFLLTLKCIPFQEIVGFGGMLDPTVGKCAVRRCEELVPATVQAVPRSPGVDIDAGLA